MGFYYAIEGRRSPQDHSEIKKFDLVFLLTDKYLLLYVLKKRKHTDGLVVEDRGESSGKAVEACAGAPLAPGVTPCPMALARSRRSGRTSL